MLFACCCGHLVQLRMRQEQILIDAVCMRLWSPCSMVHASRTNSPAPLGFLGIHSADGKLTFQINGE